MLAAIPRARHEGNQGDPEGALHIGEAAAVDDQRRVDEAQGQQQHQVREVGERFQGQPQGEDANRAAHGQECDKGGLSAGTDPAEEPGEVAQLAHGKRDARPGQDRGVGGGDHREDRARDDDHAPDRPQERPRRHAHGRFRVLGQVGHDHDQHHQRVEHRHDDHRDEDGPRDRLGRVDHLPRGRRNGRKAGKT